MIEVERRILHSQKMLIGKLCGFFCKLVEWCHYNLNIDKLSYAQ